MSLWLTRAGKYGEHEQRFLDEGRIYLTWDELDDDLHKQESKEQLRELLGTVYPTQTKMQIAASLGQIWAFTHIMQKGDWVATPSKRPGKSVIHFGQIESDYQYNAKEERPYYHARQVKWFATDIPRTAIDTDVLSTLNSMLTICRIERNNAEARIRAMAKANWKPSLVGTGRAMADDSGELAELTKDLEREGRDQIARYIQAKFTGHGMERLVEAILKAQGYTTHRSEPGPDKGIDILAAPGPLGFGQPSICVQVKSGHFPLERQILDQLIGVMQNVKAQQGLLVSWGGFKSSIDKELATHFFHVRLWGPDDIINQVLAHYDQLDADLRDELPLKQFWTVADSTIRVGEDNA